MGTNDFFMCFIITRARVFIDGISILKLYDPPQKKQNHFSLNSKRNYPTLFLSLSFSVYENLIRCHSRYAILHPLGDVFFFFILSARFNGRIF